jgi:predicted ester cyclase
MIYHIPPYPDIIGLEAYRKLIANTRMSFPDIKLKAPEIMANANSGSILWAIKGIFLGELPYLNIPPSGKKVRCTGYAYFDAKEGKVVEMWNLVDRSTMLNQLPVSVVQIDRERYKSCSMVPGRFNPIDEDFNVKKLEFLDVSIDLPLGPEYLIIKHGIL